jgi:phosphate:Na+ symporter
MKLNTAHGTAALTLAAAVLALVFAGPALGAAGEDSELSWLSMFMGLFGGLALFLFGMEQMSDGLKAAAGERMKDILARLTTNRFTAALTGAFVTAVIQSSSVTTVLVVGFVSAGLMTMAQSIGIIMGANVGTTVTAQIVAFKVEKAALAMIAIGFAMLFLSKRERVQQYGNMLMGLGLVFYGMGVMGEGMAPLRSYPPFLDLMARMENPALGILAAAVFTALVQSSSATTGIVIVMASQGFITLEAGIALAFGANIGTCITALLASLGKPREALRAAAVHVLFNVAGVLLWLAFIPQLAGLVTGFSPAHPELEGAARLAAEVPRQIANAHTVFNIANTLIFIFFTGLLAKLVEWLIPERVEVEKVIISPKYLDESLFETPALALQRVRLELGRLGEIVQDMLAGAPLAFQDGALEPIEDIVRTDDKVDVLQGDILRYLGQIRKLELTEEQSREFQALMNVTDYLEHAGDVLETDLMALARQKLDQDLEASDTMRSMLKGLHETVSHALASAVQAVRDEDQQAAQDVVALKDEIDRRINEALTHQAGKLAEDDPKRLAVFRMEMDVMDSLKRIYTLSKRMARTVLPVELGGTLERLSEEAATA